MPFQLRSIYKQLRVCTTSVQCASLRKQAFVLRRKWISDQRSAANAARVFKGGVLSKTRKLHKVRADDNMCSLARRTFSDKWGCRNLDLIARLRDFVHGSEGMTCHVDISTVSNAFSCLCRHSFLDQQAVCVSMLKRLSDTDPALFTEWVAKCLASTRRWNDYRLFVTFMGKSQLTLQLLI